MYMCVYYLCTYVHEHSELYVLDLWGNVQLCVLVNFESIVICGSSV